MGQLWLLWLVCSISLMYGGPVVEAGSGNSMIHGFEGLGKQEAFLDSPEGIQKTSRCSSVKNIPDTAKSRLSEAELRLLPSICWRQDILDAASEHSFEEQGRLVPLLQQIEGHRRGIPPGVTCNVTTWCDAEDNCSEVCKRGTVKLTKWLQNALKTQWAINRQVPLCNAVLPGTHNSGITLADGYGNLDLQFKDYFKWISWIADDSQLRTNDQVFSLTDQLNLGIRNVELDTHQVEGRLRIAHCGGYHGTLNVIVNAVNVVAKLLGHPIHWDTETIGCNPSLSSIPVIEQRTFLSALDEISDWMDQNPHEFLILYLDDQPDLLDWGAIPQLMGEIKSVFPMDVIFTPKQLAEGFNGSWPSVDTLSSLGKKVMIVTGFDYGPIIDTMMFSKEGRNTVCEWSEPDFSLFVPAPDCLTNANPLTGQTLNGTLFRQLTCELFYGPMNCNFHWSSNNDPLLDESTLPAVYQCGVNSPSPDSLTPRRASSTIWGWAPDHPYADTLEADSLPVQRRLWALIKSILGVKSNECAAISADDGRWRTVSCTAKLPVACKFSNNTWVVQPRPCPSGSLFALPEGPKDNTKLAGFIRGKFDQALINIQGPEWKIANSPLWS